MATKRNRDKRDQIKFVPITDEMWIPETFSGSLRDLFPFAAKHKAVMDSAVMRIWRLIARQGINPVRTEEARRKWGNDDLLCLTALEDFYGLDTQITEIFAALTAAAAN